MGTTLRTIIEEIGGGIPNGKKFKAAQTGGPSGGCIPSVHIDTPIDYESLSKIGSMMGSGGLIIMDEDTCMVDIAKFYLEFTCEESCGKCSPCRIGTKRLLQMLDDITKGNATLEELDKIEELAAHMKVSCLCALGQTASNPVVSKKCKELLHYVIDPDKCKGCTLCSRNCPVGAISGKVKEPHHIDINVCIKCGLCKQNCKFDAVYMD